MRTERQKTLIAKHVIVESNKILKTTEPSTSKPVGFEGFSCLTDVGARAREALHANRQRVGTHTHTHTHTTFWVTDAGLPGKEWVGGWCRTPGNLFGRFCFAVTPLAQKSERNAKRDGNAAQIATQNGSINLVSKRPSLYSSLTLNLTFLNNEKVRHPPSVMEENCVLFFSPNTEQFLQYFTSELHHNSNRVILLFFLIFLLVRPISFQRVIVQIHTAFNRLHQRDNRICTFWSFEPYYILEKHITAFTFSTELEDVTKTYLRNMGELGR